MTAPNQAAFSTPDSLRVALFTPMRERCGISDYSRHLLAALRALPGIGGIQTVAAPNDAAQPGSLAALRRFSAEERRFRELGAQMNEDAPDIAHIQHQYFFFGGVAPHKNHARAFLDAVRVPLVMTVHEIAWPAPNASPVARAALTLTNRANFLHPAIRRFLVHTPPDRERLTAMGVQAARIHVLPVGAPPAAPLPDPLEAKRALGLNGKQVITLFGFLSTKKGHRLALEAMSLLPEDVCLLFAGEQHPDDHTDYVPGLQAEIKARGLTERVHLTGYLPEEQIPVVMAATDIAIAPFTQSSGSASLAHLLAYGRPILASNIPPHREIVRETPACLALFRSEDATDFAREIKALLSDADRRAELQAAARAYAMRHSYENMARETLEVYRQALKSV